MDKQTLKQAYKNAPQKLRQYIDGNTWDDGSAALAKAAGVAPDYINDFIDEVLLTLLGLEDMSSFKERIGNIPSIDSDKARQLDQNVYGSIFHNLTSEINELKKKMLEFKEEELYELGDMPEEYHDKFEALPNDVREAISSNNSAEKIRLIGKKHKLHIDQVGELGTQTGLVMLGVLPPKDFVKAITDKLNVNQDLARLIAADINTEIFTPIRESLKKIHHLDFSGEVKTPEQSPQPTTEPAKEPLISAFAAKTSGPVATNQQESVITPGNQPQKPKKDFDPYRESI